MPTHVQLVLYHISDIDEYIKNEFRESSIVSFVDQQQCLDHIKSTSKTEVLFLIISLLDAMKILNAVHDLRQLDSIFIYCSEQQSKQDEDSLEKFSKIIDMFDTLSDLVQAIRENIDLSIQQIESFNFYEQRQKSTRDLSKEAGAFLWLRLFKDVVLNLPHDDQAKQELIETLRLYYRNNHQQLKRIERFSQEYELKTPIRWYTGQPFLYKQLNRALRTEDISLLYTFRYFIHDLSKHLEQEFQQQREDFNSLMRFYRGIRLSNGEVKKLEANVGKLLSTNGYLSTTFSKKTALIFAGQSTNNEEEIVLFEIEYNVDEINSIHSASIVHLSEHPDEEEILFDLDAAFQLQSITRDQSSNVVLVKMKAVDEGSTITKEYIEQHHKYMSRGSVVLVFGHLLAEIGEYDKSQNYFERLLKNPNNEDISFIYYYLGVNRYYQGDYESALKYYQESYERLISAVPAREGATAFVLNDIGSIFKIRGQYDTALDYFQRGLKISETHSNYHIVASLLENIGTIYRIKGDSDRALTYHKRCLHIQEQHLPDIHKEIAKTLANIAVTFGDKDNLDKALEYYQKSLHMKQQCLPAEHPDIATSLHYVGNALNNQGKWDEAIDYYTRALQIREKSFL